MFLQDVQKHKCKQKSKKTDQQILQNMEELEQQPRKNLTYIWELRELKI